MIKEVRLASKYLSHYIYSMNEHGAHSPFLFKLLTECIYAKNNNKEFENIEELREQLKHNSKVINIEDLGAGSKYDGLSTKRSISSITKNFSKPPRLCKLLYRLTSYFKPQLMLELGTSMGISAMYQAIGNPNGSLHTIEGCSSTFKQASDNIKKLGFTNINCINDSFDVALQLFISEHGYPDWVYIDGNHTYDSTINYFNLLSESDNEDMIIVFDDINWSEGMQRAWKEICNNKKTSMTVNLFYMGLG